MKYQNDITVTNTGGRYETVIHTGTHQLVADEPVDKGGTNLGPAPHQLLLSSLGTCIAITVRMYADRKQWPLDSVRVILNMDERTAEGPVVIRRRLEFTGGLDDDQRRRLSDIASRCPVHKTLTGEITVTDL